MLAALLQRGEEVGWGGGGILKVLNSIPVAWAVLLVGIVDLDVHSATSCLLVLILACTPQLHTCWY